MNFFGLILGACVLVLIALFHIIVVKFEYYVGAKFWPGCSWQPVWCALSFPFWRTMIFCPASWVWPEFSSFGASVS